MFAKKQCQNEGSKDHKIRNFFDQHKLMENEGTVILVYIYQVSWVGNTFDSLPKAFQCVCTGVLYM